MTTTTNGTRRSRLIAGAIGASATLALATAALFAIAPAASAATPGVQLSSDGVHFASTYSGSLFDSAALMVPQSTQTGTFWVKNASGEAAYLRVSVGSVTGGGTPFSGALTVRASTPSSSGSAVGVDAAVPCYVLTQGQYLAPGAVARVDATLAIGDLTGTTGQTSNVDFDILVGLSSAATGSMPATSCLGNSGTVPGTPGGGGGTGGSGGTGGHAGGGHAGGGSSATGVDSEGAAGGIVDLPTKDDGSAFEGEGASAGILNSNTGRLFQEWYIFAWIFGAVAGGGIQLLVARRRANAYGYDDEYEAEEVTQWQVDGRMSGRKAWSTTSVSV